MAGLCHDEQCFILSSPPPSTSAHSSLEIMDMAHVVGLAQASRAISGAWHSPLRLNHQQSMSMCYNT